MNRIHLRNFFFLSISLAVLSGCAPFLKKNKATYETISVDPSHDTKTAKEANERALELMAKGKFAKAEAQLRKALAADVTYGPAHNNLGELYYCQKKMYLAAWEFEYAAKLMSERPEPYNNLGLVLESVGKLDEAIEAYQTAYEMQPQNPQIIGNLVRARYQREPSDPSVRTLLQELLFVETRPHWLRWAREVLALEKNLSCEPMTPSEAEALQPDSLETVPAPFPISKEPASSILPSVPQSPANIPETEVIIGDAYHGSF